MPTLYGTTYSSHCGLLYFTLDESGRFANQNPQSTYKNPSQLRYRRSATVADVDTLKDLISKV